MHKKTLPNLILLALFILAALVVDAQQTTTPATSTGTTDEQANEANVQLMRQDLRAKRREVVAANVPLTPEEASRFWPLYDQYIAETIKIDDVRFDLIKT